ncbi:TetR/AcrR family transcriptional regulator [Actinoplanes sp. RD1]|uniref:TetR/AcrR family transcriptional regulator n=1 Tax=Actinoplanes sp. RD1 TaxID=3064538 RepID=UPI002741586E|nr:TetR/AcrR family transcriptional regulator [Actinoplanes sp. RD1]
MRGDNLYDDLLAAAIELASTRMSLAVPSLRAVARACAVSATAVYRHFASQSDLNQAVLLRIDASFVEGVAGADDPGRPPRERLRVLAHGYLTWGLANPGLYQLRFESAEQLGADHVHSDAADALLGRIGELLEAAGGASGLTAQDLWACAHGVVSLRIHKPDHPWPEQPAVQLDRLLTTWGFAG